MKKFRRFNSEFEIEEKIIFRDFLALERTTLANERTLFAYIRSGIYLSVAGLAILKLEHFEPLIWLGYSLFVISVIFIVFGMIRYHLLQKKLNQYYDMLEKKKEEQSV